MPNRHRLGKAGKTARKAAKRPVSRGKGHAVKPSKAAAGRPRRKWSQQVTRKSDALTLEDGVFKLRSPLQIAASLKRSADRSHRRKSAPFRSAMSMLNFYMNRAGKNLSASRRRVLEQAKVRLRQLYRT